MEDVVGRLDFGQVFEGTLDGGGEGGAVEIVGDVCGEIAHGFSGGWLALLSL
jgi:hypothetical protein